MTDNYLEVANPGSAIGEAIGASMERALQAKLEQLADEYGCHFLTSGVRRTKAGTVAKKLLMSDNYGNEYDIDGVLANEQMQPLIIFESKYIRYKKHNRDKGSWICTAHSAVRRRYHSIRSSIAVLAGNWSGTSLAMIRSHDINLFLVPFETITTILKELGVVFEWGEKENDKAREAWNDYNRLSQEQQDSIGEKMIAEIEDELFSLIKLILDDSLEREIEKIVVEIVSNLGEVKIFEFSSVDDALEFLGQDDLKYYFITTDSLTLFDPPPEIE